MNWSAYNMSLFWFIIYLGVLASVQNPCPGLPANPAPIRAGLYGTLGSLDFQDRHPYLLGEKCPDISILHREQNPAVIAGIDRRS